MHNASRFENYLLTFGNLCEACEVYDHEIKEVEAIRPVGIALYFDDQSIYFFIDPKMHHASAASPSSILGFSAESKEQLLKRLLVLAENPVYQPLQHAFAKALTTEETIK